MSLRVNRLAAGLILAGCTQLVHAAGFALIEQNASGLGNAYAGPGRRGDRTPARFSSTRPG